MKLLKIMDLGRYLISNVPHLKQAGLNMVANPEEWGKNKLLLISCYGGNHGRIARRLAIEN